MKGHTNFVIIVDAMPAQNIPVIYLQNLQALYGYRATE